MTKALILETNKILNVESKFSISRMKMSFNIDDEKILNDISDFSRPITDEYLGDYYKLSDGKDYHSDKLIIGLNNIRDYKLTKVL